MYILFSVDVWGFDDSAVAVLQNMKLSSEHEDVSTEVSGLEKYAILLKGTLSMGEGITTAAEHKNETMKLLKVIVDNGRSYFSFLIILL